MKSLIIVCTLASILIGCDQQQNDAPSLDYQMQQKTLKLTPEEVKFQQVIDFYVKNPQFPVPVDYPANVVNLITEKRLKESEISEKDFPPDTIQPPPPETIIRLVEVPQPCDCCGAQNPCPCCAGVTINLQQPPAPTVTEKAPVEKEKKKKKPPKTEKPCGDEYTVTASETEDFVVLDMKKGKGTKIGFTMNP
jgi:hypothetical protein